jgi:predicted nucleotidyltransferase
MRVYEVNSELEDYRLHALYMIKENTSWIKKTAEEVLGRPVISIKPIGSVTNPSKFTEDSDIDVAVYVESGKVVDEELSAQLQDVMIRHPINDIGVLNTIVFK